MWIPSHKTSARPSLTLALRASARSGSCLAPWLAATSSGLATPTQPCAPVREHPFSIPEILFLVKPSTTSASAGVRSTDTVLPVRNPRFRWDPTSTIQRSHQSLAADVVSQSSTNILLCASVIQCPPAPSANRFAAQVSTRPSSTMEFRRALLKTLNVVWARVSV